MRDVQLPDGTWATSAYFAGPGMPPSQCPGDTCAWEDIGPPTPPGLLPVQVQLQTCPRCGWNRARYLTDPDPDEDA